MFDLEIYADALSAYEEAREEEFIDHVNMLLNSAMMTHETIVDIESTF